jgi:hypothetical protein
MPLVDVKQGGQLLHAGKYGHLIRLDLAQARRPQERTDVGPDLLPVPFDLFLDVDLVDPQPVRDLQGIRGFRVEQARVEVEGIGERMGGVHAHDQCAITQLRQPQTRRRRQAGLAHAALATKQ